MSASYATVADYEAVYGPYGDDALLQAWLDKASRKIQAELGGTTPTGDLLKTCSDIACDMVNRALDATDTGLPVGMTQFSMTAGSYTRSGSFPSGYGALYITKSEKQQLGTASCAAFQFPGLQP